MSRNIPEAIEWWRQAALTSALGQVTCNDGDHEGDCEHCGAQA